MFIKRLQIYFFLICIILLTGCLNFSSTSETQPECPSIYSFGRISEHIPSEFKITTTTPTFTWFYTTASSDPVDTNAWDAECVPDSYSLHLSTGPDFTDDIVYQITNPSVTPDPTKLTMAWTLPSPLNPVSVYRWFIVGHYGGIEIGADRLPKLHQHDWWPPLSSYYRSVLRTGPQCSSSQIAVPSLVSPANGATVQTLNPVLDWTVSSCSPLVYLIEVSTTPSFSDPQWYADPSIPGDYTDITQSNSPILNVAYILRDCTQYFWRIKGGVGEGNSADPRVWGNYSAVHSFIVSEGWCPTPTPPPETTCSDLGQAACLEKPQCEWVSSLTNFPHCIEKP